MHFIYLINTEKPKTHLKLITVSLIHCHMYCSLQKREEKTKTLVCLKKKCKYQCSVECTELYENHSLSFLPPDTHSEDEDPEYRPLRMPFKDDLDVSLNTACSIMS